jgi:threonine dehydrogenase-like Zn-dependent dehydrogenase
MPIVEKGDILRYEPMGEVVEVGGSVKNLKKEDRVVVPITISCGSCWFCQKTLFSC